MSSYVAPLKDMQLRNLGKPRELVKDEAHILQRRYVRAHFFSSSTRVGTI